MRGSTVVQLIQRLLTVSTCVALGALAVAAPAAADGGPSQTDHRSNAGWNNADWNNAGWSTEIIETARGHGDVVSLTFDDGPDPVHTPDLLAVLRQHRVKAVFCLWGDHVQEHPGIVRMIVAHGHTLCNHGMHHDDMGTWTPEQIRADLLETQAAIRDAVPYARIPYFRAPFGSWGQTPEVAAQLGMRSLGWRLAVADWETPGTDELVRRLEDGITPGAVVLLHDGGGDRSQTVAAVDQIIPAFKADGWRFVLPSRRC